MAQVDTEQTRNPYGLYSKEYRGNMSPTEFTRFWERRTEEEKEALRARFAAGRECVGTKLKTDDKDFHVLHILVMLEARSGPASNE
jgi:hypothetical protein